MALDYYGVSPGLPRSLGHPFLPLTRAYPVGAAVFHSPTDVPCGLFCISASEAQKQTLWPQHSGTSRALYWPSIKQLLCYRQKALLLWFGLVFVFVCSTGVWTQGLYLEPHHQPFCVCVCWVFFFFFFFFEIGFPKLFAWADFKLQSSWSLSPK
jgi:hypothetical protein